MELIWHEKKTGWLDAKSSPARLHARGTRPASGRVEMTSRTSAEQRQGTRTLHEAARADLQMEREERRLNPHALRQVKAPQLGDGLACSLVKRLTAKPPPSEVPEQEKPPKQEIRRVGRSKNVPAGRLDDDRWYLLGPRAGRHIGLRRPPSKNDDDRCDWYLLDVWWTSTRLYYLIPVIKPD